MKTYEIEYDGSAGPEDAMAGRAWDVVEMVDGRTTSIIASRCTGENAERIMECLNASERAAARKMELESALFAIVDRIQGVFDSPYLKPWGQLTTISDDVLRIATSTLKGTRR